MTEPVDTIAARLIEAAYEFYGQPPDPGGEYIAADTRRLDVPAYFREVVKLAREPRSQQLWDRTKVFFESDAAMVMEAGLKTLSSDTAMPATERLVIDELAAFEKWRGEMEAKSNASANEAAARAADTGQ